MKLTHWLSTLYLQRGISWKARSARRRMRSTRPFPISAEIERLEDRTLLSAIQAFEPVVVTGVDAGTTNDDQVKVFDAATFSQRMSFNAYPGFNGGVRVATGDVTGDNIPDIITAAGTTGGPHVKIYDGSSPDPSNPVLIRQFYAYDPGFTGGVFVAAGDVDDDGRADVITGADAGGGPDVRVFLGADILTGADWAVPFKHDLFAFGSNYSGGVRVAAGYFNDDDNVDIVVGQGTGDSNGAEVKVLDGTKLDDPLQGVLFDRWVYQGVSGGVYLAAGDVTHDGKDDVITGPGTGGGPDIRVYDGRDFSQAYQFWAYNTNFTGGVRVGAVDANADGRADVVTAAGPTGGPHVKVFNVNPLQELHSQFVYQDGFAGGVYANGNHSDTPQTATAVEGQPFDVDLTLLGYSSVSIANITQWTVDWGDGSAPQTVNDSTSPISHVYADDGTYDAFQAVAYDASGSLASNLVKVVVNDPGPTLTLSGDPVDEGPSTPFTLHLSAIEHTADTVTQWTIDWGDNTTPEIINGNPSSVMHAYADDDNYTIQATVTQDDGNTFQADDFLATIQDVPPSLSLSGDPVDEGPSTPFALHLSATDPGADTVTQWTIDWGDNTTPEIINGNPSSVMHAYADDDNYTIQATVTQDDGREFQAADFIANILDVAPTISLIGPDTVLEGNDYILNLGPVIDPGTDTVSQGEIDWADGTIDPFTGSPPTSASHQYAAKGDYTVHVNLTNEDGTFSDVGTKDITVTPVSLSLSGPSTEVYEGDSYQLDLSATGGGVGSIDHWTINWGDGVVQSFAGNPTSESHIYADNGSYTISAFVTLDDGESFNASDLAAEILNVPPTVNLSGLGSIDEGTTYSLTVEAVDDRGADTVNQWRIDWGDGTFNTYITPPGTKTHFYADNGTYPISVQLTDEDGTWANAGTKSLTVNVVPPTVAFADYNLDYAYQGNDYALAFSVTDQGDDTISHITINWGDNTSDTYTGVIESAGHIYNDLTSHTIWITLEDEDGIFQNVAQNTVSVHDQTRLLVAPVFGSSTYSWTPYENVAVNTVVGQVHATDDFWQTVSYSLGEDSFGTPFDVNETTGEITVSYELDYEWESSYTLSIIATDSDWNESTAEVYVNVQDIAEAPAFNQSSFAFSVPEDAQSGALLTTVSAADPQPGDTVTYSLSPDEGYEQFGNSFAINSATGQITVQGPLDYEMAGGYVSLTVYAFDNEANIGETQVQVNIDDVDNDPEFIDDGYGHYDGFGSYTFDPLPENALAGTSVGQVQAWDPLDETLTYSLDDGYGGAGVFH